MQILLLSNSTIAGKPYFSFAKQHLLPFLGNKTKHGCFIPYAGVTISFESYFETVNQHFNGTDHTIESLHSSTDKIESIEKANFIMIGGGNTFQLLAELQKYNLLEPIRQKVQEGTPYVGWSAGSNICCPTIGTTNDMPIVCPQNFDALNLIPFQINPHYTNAALPNHGGETRDTRILEYIEVNREKYVAGLPENCLFKVEGSNLTYQGEKLCRIFKYGAETHDLSINDNFQFLMH